MGKKFRALFCCGSRPELIKIAPVIDHCHTLENIDPLLCLTGQHRELLSCHLDYFNLIPQYRLNVLRQGQSLDQLMQLLFEQLPAVIEQAEPDIVIVQGDTASALASAIMAHKANIPVAHIEAGLRTYDQNSPFPEEIYRQSISKITKWHFCPTKRARQNLWDEKIPSETIFVTGNTAVDAVLKTMTAIKADQNFSPLHLTNKPYFLITLHRRESQGAPLRRIVTCLLDFANKRRNFGFVLPLHANPNTADMIQKRLGQQPNIHLIPAVSYPHMVSLMARAFAIITDSGGIQEEAPSLNTPVIIVRENTERPEGIESGCLRLAGTRPDRILYELNLLIDDPSHYNRMKCAENPFGDGFAAQRIAAHLQDIVTRHDIWKEKNNNDPSL